MSRDSRAILDEPPAPADRRIAYGEGAFHFGDLREPPRTEGAPLVVVVHGGFWRTQYDLVHAGHLCAALADEGIATFSVEYRRIGHPGGGWPGTAEDVARALDFALDLDFDRVALFGHSAGGHLALLAARGRPVRGVVAAAPVADLREAWRLRLGDGVVEDFLSGSEDAIAEASPIELLPLGVPQVVVHGTGDEIVPIELARRYVDAAGTEARLVTLEGAGHFEPVDPRSAEWPQVVAAIRDVLGR